MDTRPIASLASLSFTQDSSGEGHFIDSAGRDCCRRLLGNRFVIFAVQHAGQSDQSARRARWAIARAVAHAMAVRAKIRTGQGHVLHRIHRHGITPPVVAALEMMAQKWESSRDLPLTAPDVRMDATCLPQVVFLFRARMRRVLILPERTCYSFKLFRKDRLVPGGVLLHL